MVKLGKVYGNLMVDLQATNQKLADRSARIVSTLTGLPRDQAEELLQRCDGDVKLSFLVHQRGVSLETARQLLEQVRGRVREALNQDIVVSAADPDIAGPALVLGVDGGGSKTLAWLMDATSETDGPRGIGQSGPSNPLTAGWHAALANIELAISRAFIAAGISRRHVAAACLSIAGTGREIDRLRLQRWAENRRFAERVVTTHDALAVLTAGTSAGIGIAVISGTGSFAFGRDETGRTARAGGWGPLLGDEGSGEAIARAALHAVTRAHDGTGPATLLTDTLLTALNAATAFDLREALSRDSSGTRRLSTLAPFVFAAAEAGDDVAGQIVETAARELAQLVLATHIQLSGEQRGREFQLAIAGGVLVHAELLRQRTLAAIADAGLYVSQLGLVVEPVRGSCRLAQSAAAS
jgi:N-acetylglucosamine kinase-like BadF-type ATPase